MPMMPLLAKSRDWMTRLRDNALIMDPEEGKITDVHTVKMWLTSADDQALAMVAVFNDCDDVFAEYRQL